MISIVGQVAVAVNTAVSHKSQDCLTSMIPSSYFVVHRITADFSHAFLAYRFQFLVLLV